MRPKSFPAFSLPIRTALEPSTMPDELPGVCTCSTLLYSLYFARITSSKPICPGISNDGLSRAKPSIVVSALIKSSRSKMVMPDASLTGTTDLSNQPLSRACAALRCDSTAYASTSSRLYPSMVAIISAPMPCGTKPVFSANAGSLAMAPPLEPIGTRDIHSMPPATTRSSQPDATFCAAVLTASKPDAQNRSN